MIPDFENWKRELIITGKLPQDYAPPEDDYKWDRYIELLEMAEGIYEQRIFHALVDSMQVEFDNEVYEFTIRLIFSFPPSLFGVSLVESLPSLITRLPNKAGDLVSLIINNSCRDKMVTSSGLITAIQWLLAKFSGKAHEYLSNNMNDESYSKRWVPYSGVTFLSEFNKALREADIETREIIRQFIQKEEENGWLGNKPGYFEPAFTS